MKKHLILPMILILTLLLSGCELFIEDPTPTINLVSVALNYEAAPNEEIIRGGITYEVKSITTLNCTLSDQNCVELQLEAMCNKAGYQFHSYKYTENNGEYLYTKDGIKEEFDHTHGIKSSLTEFLQDNTRQSDSDILIFYFSGHGASDGSLAMSGTEKTQNVFMSPSELYSLIKEQRGKKLILLDSCFSGNIVTDTEGTLSKDDIFSAGWSTLFGTEATTNHNVWALVASQSDNQSVELESYGHGLFTYYLLKGLGSPSPSSNVAGTSSSLYSMDGVLTVSELYDYINKKVSHDYNNLTYQYSPAPNSSQITQNATSVLDLVLFKF